MLIWIIVDLIREYATVAMGTASYAKLADI
jgi:hypothetical protein